MHIITEDQRDCLANLDFSVRQKEILKEEYRNGEWYSNDIRNVTGDSIPRADCWCFGAPCQDFSVAGKRKGLDGDRSSLVREVFRVLSEIREEDRPEWLIYENVKGMLSSNRGWDFLAIILEMEQLGYDVEWQLFNSKNFGVPQNRERVYTIGHLRDRGRYQIFPLRKSNEEDSVRINPEVIGGIGEKSFGTQYQQQNRICNGHKVATALTSNLSGNVNYYAFGVDIGSEDLPVDKGFNGRHIVHTPSGVCRTLIGCSQGTGSGNEPKLAIPVLTPDRAEKRQNGRRFKENGEDMFTLTAQDRHGVAITPMGVLRTIRSDYGKAIRKDYESGKLNLSRHEFTEKEVRTDNITNTLDSVQKDNLLALQISSSTGVDISGNKILGMTNVSHCLNANDQRKVFGAKQERTLAMNIIDTPAATDTDSVTSALKVIGGLQEHQQRRDDKISPCLTSAMGMGGGQIPIVWYEKYNCNVTIRKLTPRECFRLQGWTDDYFEKAAFVNSDSQLYKQAGNGVTVNVVQAIGEAILTPHSEAEILAAKQPVRIHSTRKRLF